MLQTTINGYTLTKLIGEGGMAKVYYGEPTLGRPVAVKVLNPEYLAREDTRQKFMREAKIMHQINHPNIVPLINFIEQHETIYIFMEYIDGFGLREYVHHHLNNQEIQKKLQLFCKILDAFIYAHQLGVIHRDIKPSNILVRKHDHEPIILDFGIAKIEDDIVATHTRTGVAIGTPIYMSPEQVKDSKHIDQRSDIYALGVVLWELVAGKPLFSQEELQLSDYEIKEKVVKQALPTLPLPNKQDANFLDILIAKATAKNPQQRYANCKEFKEAILAFGTYAATSEQEKTTISNSFDKTTINAQPTEKTQINPIAKNTPPPIADSPKEILKPTSNENKKSKTPIGYIIISAVVLLLIALTILFVVVPKKDPKTEQANADNTTNKVDTTTKQIPANNPPATQATPVQETTQPEVAKDNTNTTPVVLPSIDLKGTTWTWQEDNQRHKTIFLVNGTYEDYQSKQLVDDGRWKLTKKDAIDYLTYIREVPEGVQEIVYQVSKEGDNLKLEFLEERIGEEGYSKNIIRLKDKLKEDSGFQRVTILKP